MNSRDMLELVDVLASEKNVAKDVVFGVLELALASAVKRARFPGEDADIVVRVDRTTGEFSAVQIGRASCGKECRSRWSPYH